MFFDLKSCQGSFLNHWRTCLRGNRSLILQFYPGLDDFITAVSLHFCVNLPAAFSQPGNANVAEHYSIQLPFL